MCDSGALARVNDTNSRSGSGSSAMASEEVEDHYGGSDSGTNDDGPDQVRDIR
jgi:hypothetical protein